MALRFGLGLGSIGGRGASADNDMILVYEIPSAGTPIQLAIQANSTWFSAGQKAVIDWGDGSAAETVSATGGSTYIGHTYTDARTYTILISGSMTMYGRNTAVNIAGQTLLTHIHSFGKLGITSFQYAFYLCTWLMSVPKTLPSSVTSMTNMFRDCSGDAFNPDVSNWNVSNVTSMSYMFYNCRGAEFNPDVSNWDVSNVEKMFYMFGDCRGAAFNPDVSNWNVSKATDMTRMFYKCSGDAFRGGRGVDGNGIANWRLRMIGVIMSNFMSSSKTQEPAFLDEILNAWADLHADGQLPTNITVDFGTNNKYTAAGAAAYTTLTDTVANGGAGWTIASGELQA